MKILFSPCHYIFDSRFEGGEVSWAYNIAHRLALVFPGSLVVTGYNNDRGNPTSYQVIELQLKQRYIDMSLRNAIKFNFSYFLETRRQIARGDFDILHHVLPFGFNSTFNLFVLSNIKSKAFPTVIGPLQSPLGYADNEIDTRNVRNTQPQKKRLDVARIMQTVFALPLRFLSNLTLKKAARIVVVNQYTKNLLMENNISGHKIVVIPPGIDTEHFQQTIPMQKPLHDIEIITVNNLVKRKGIDLIIKAFNILAQRYAHITLKIIGDGRAKKDLERLFSQLNLKNRIVFYGHIPNHNIKNVYQKADVFVRMSRSKSWGQVYLEAMACGLPIISTKSVGSQSIIRDGVFGFLIEQEDIDGLAAKLAHLIENEQLRWQFGQAARKEVEENYDWNNVIIPKYIEVYQELLRKCC